MSTQPKAQTNHPKYRFSAAIPFILVHLACLATFWTGITTTALVLFITLFVIRGLAIVIGYHRYFSHKAFETSRWFQFVLAFLAQATTQQGVIWWANHHRRHHKYSDTPQDVHSPRQQGFWYAHVGWIFTDQYLSRDYDMVADWQKYPELRWIDKYYHLPPIIVGAIAFFIGGFSGLIFGFFASTVALYHMTFSINSLTHRIGKQRYMTADDSRNVWWLGLIAFGEGWHNNHHYYSTCARQGFRWWEIDMGYYVIRMLAACGIVWNVKEPPAAVLAGTLNIPPKVAVRAKELLANANCNLDAISSKLSEIAVRLKRMVENPSQQLSQSAREIRSNLEQLLESLRERAQTVEQLPPKLAAIIKVKMREASQFIDNTLRTFDLKLHINQAITAIESAARTLELQELKAVN